MHTDTQILLWAIGGSFSILFTLMSFMWFSLNARMERLDSRMDRLESRMDRLESRMDKIEETIKDIDRRLCRLEGAFSSKEFCRLGIEHKEKAL